jgi:hypothetical protein
LSSTLQEQQVLRFTIDQSLPDNKVQSVKAKLILSFILHRAMNTNKRTTIRVARKIRERLKSLGRKGETHNNTTMRLINETNREEIIRRQYERLEEKDKFISLEGI